MQLLIIFRSDTAKYTLLMIDGDYVGAPAVSGGDLQSDCILEVYLNVLPVRPQPPLAGKQCWLV